MENITAIFRQAINALLLRDEAYRAMRDNPNPFTRGLVFIVSVALIVAIISLIGAILLWLTSPDLGAIQDVVWQEMQDMPWVEQISPSERDAALQQTKRFFDLGWQISRLFVPSIGNAIASVVLNPVALVIGWLIYGLLAFLSARVLGGKGRLDQTYGTTALAAAPRILGVVHVLPYVETAGLGIWGLICSYLAIKNTHELSPWRTFWATVIPLIVLVLFVIGLAIIGASIAAVSLGGGPQT